MAGLQHSRVEEGEAGEESGAVPRTLHRDDVFHLLQNSRRRAALRHLFEHNDGQSAVMRDVAEAVAAWEHDTTVARLTSDKRQRVYIALYQSHLPKLAEHDVIDYDQSRGAVELRPLASVLRPYLGDGLDDPDAEMVQSTSDPAEKTGILPTLSSLFD